jgi:hypothetical protein
MESKMSACEPVSLKLSDEALGQLQDLNGRMEGLMNRILATKERLNGSEPSNGEAPKDSEGANGFMGNLNLHLRNLSYNLDTAHQFMSEIEKSI